MNTRAETPAERAVIIATAAMSRLYLEGLADELIADGKEVKIVSYHPAPLLDEHACDRLRSRGVEIEQFFPESQRERITNRREAFSTVRKWVSVGSVDLFQANPNHFLANWLCFSRERQERWDIRPHLMPEGLANFYVAKMNHNDITSRPAAVANRLLGVPFFRNVGTVLGLESVDYRQYWYIGAAGMMGEYMKTRRFDVNRPAPCVPDLPDGLLFLGHPCAEGDARDLYVDLLRAASRMGHSQIHYKPHPYEVLSDDFRSMVESLGFTILGSDHSAEQLALSYRAVAGVLSSGLVNLRVLGWHEETYGVLEPEALVALGSRTLEECRNISEAATRLGIRPVPGFHPVSR